MIRFLFSLRSRLVLLVLMAVLPTLGVFLYDALQHRRIAASQVEKSMLELAQVASGVQNHNIEGARQFLYTLSQLPQVRSRDSQACSSLFADLLEQNWQYSIIGAADLEGNIFASGLPMKTPVNIADRPYFRQTLQTRRFAIGDYQTGRVSGKSSLHLAQVIFDRELKVKGVVFVGLDLAWLNRMAAHAEIPKGGELLITDRTGTILARYPEPENWVGKKLSAEPIIQTILAHQGEGRAEIAGVDGVRRLYAFLALGKNIDEHAGLFLGIGLPAKTIYAPINRLFVSSLTLLGSVASLTLVAAWLIGQFGLLRPVNTLLKTTRQLASGDLGSRSSVAYYKGELGQLAHDFDLMAESLQEREAERNRVEETLRQSRQELQAIHDGMTDGLLIADLETGELFQANPSLCRMLGYPEDELLKMSAAAIHPPENLAEILGRFKDLRTGKIHIAENVPFLRKDGRIFFGDVTANPIVYQARSCIVSFVRDVTQRKAAEETVRQEKDKAQKYLDVAGVMLVVIEADQRVSLINKKGCEVLGCGEEEIVGKNWFDNFLPERMRSEVKKIFETLMNGGNEHYEHVEGPLLLPKSGKERLIAWHNSVLRDKEGKIVRTLSSGEDISERKEAERAIRRSEEKYRRLHESMKDGFVLVDRAGRIKECNESFLQMLGYTPAEILKLTYIDLTPAKWHAFEQKIIDEEVLSRGYSEVYEKEYRKKDGTLFPVELRTFVIKDVTGENIGMWAIVRDISERRRREETLRESEAEASRLAQEIAVIAEIGRIIGSSLDIGEVYELFALEAQKLIEFDRLSITVENREEDKVSFPYVWGVPVPARNSGDIISFSGSPTAEVFKTGSSLFRCFESESEVVFQMPGYLPNFQAGLKSLMLIPLFSRNGVIGALGFLSKKSGAYGEKEQRFAENIGHHIAGAIANAQFYAELKEAEKRLGASLEEKVVLLKEIHHRVKNNMQIISSLLNLQSQSIKDSQILGILRVGQNRVKSMALIHEKLYQSGDLARINFGEYLRSLTNSLLHSYQNQENAVAVRIEAEDIFLGVDTAIPCGLIVNELVSNAFKHAFLPGTKGEIKVGLTPAGDHQLVLRIRDNGIGLPADLDFRHTKTLGMQLINTLSDQLEGMVEVDRRGGTEFRIAFKR